MRYCWWPHYGQAALDSPQEEASPGLSQAAARTASCSSLTWKWDQEKSGSLLLLEVLCRKILPGMFISWESESQRILVNTKKRPNSLAKVITVGLWQCRHNLQLHLELLILPISSHLAPHTSSCQVVSQLIPIQTSVLARFREKREMIPSGSALKKSRSRMSPACWWHSSQTTAAMWALSRSCDRAALVRHTSKFTDKGKTELMINSCQILSVEELYSLISFIQSCWQMKQS